MSLIIGSLDKSNVQTASKGVATIKKHSVLKTVLLELMLDVLLLPYKWSGSDEDALAGFNTSSLKRLRINLPLIFTDADYHEQVNFSQIFTYVDVFLMQLLYLIGQVGNFGFDISKYI